MKAARLLQPGKALVIQDVPVPTPREDQVLVDVEACGVCHTDVELRKGSIGSLKTEMIGMRHPVTLGHEIAGTVDQVGESVTGFSKGERVLVDWVSGDGDCYYCRMGEEAMCNKVKYLGIHLDGGYAEKVLVPHQRHVFKLGSLSSAEAAPLADAGLSAYSATMKANLSSEKLVTVVGLGGLGLMAVQFAARVHGAQVIAVGRRDETLDAAKKAGATHLVNSGRTDAGKEIMKISGGKGSDAVIDLVCSEQTLKTYPGVLAKSGAYVMVGLFGGNLVAHGPLMTLRNYSFIGSNYGNRKLFEEVIALAESKKIQPITTATMGLEESNRALDNLDHDKTVGRQVLVP
jgi:alcohol dehydrogenase, propanol-preferring